MASKSISSPAVLFPIIAMVLVLLASSAVAQPNNGNGKGGNATPTQDLVGTINDIIVVVEQVTSNMEVFKDLVTPLVVALSNDLGRLDKAFQDVRRLENVLKA